MNIQRPNFGLPIPNHYGSGHIPRTVGIKLVLGAIFLFTFFSTYQPTFSIPPIKESRVYAQEIVPTIVKDSLPVDFSLPHPGYISTKFSPWHPGVDIASGLAMPVHPIAPGVVIDTGYNFWGLGLIVQIDHGFGYSSLYAHLGKIYIKKGDKVDKNNLIGEVGLTGRTSGPHTHLEVYKNGKNIDPIVILPKINDYPTD